MLKRYVVQIMLALSFIVPFHSHAEEKSAVPQLAYFTLEPDLTTNFFTKGNKLGYIKYASILWSPMLQISPLWSSINL